MWERKKKGPWRVLKVFQKDEEAHTAARDRALSEKQAVSRNMIRSARF